MIAAVLAGATTARAQAPATSPDDSAKSQAQALVTDGVALLEVQNYPRALDKFLAAYDLFPSPKILLNIGSTLRDMGRLAEAANTYERYLEDPATGTERVAEVKGLLNDLDKKVALLVVQVTPSGADVSIDGGPWTTIGVTLTTRVAAGTHMVRARKAGLEDAEVSITGFEGARKDVQIALELKIAAEISTTTTVEPPPARTPTPTDTHATPPDATPPKPDKNNTTGWMITGPHAGRIGARQGHSGTGVVPGDVHVSAVGESLMHIDETEPPPTTEAPPRIEGSLQTRIDGKLRGAAIAIGVAYDPTPTLQAEAAMMFSKDLNGVIPGAYAGLRLHFLDGRFRPLVGGGVPVFWSGGAARVGARIGAGAELVVTDHLSLLADVGFEHFFNPQSPYEANVVVPILGVHGRM